MIKMIPNKKLDPNYNYLSDAIDATGIYQFKPEDYHFCDEEKVCNISININGKCYKDPDKVSNRLYNDLSLLTNLDFVDKDYNVLSLVYDRPIEDSERSFSIIESRHHFDLYLYLIKFKIMNRSKRLCGIEI